MYNDISLFPTPLLSDQNISPAIQTRARSHSWDETTRQALSAALEALPDREAFKREMRQRRLRMITRENNNAQGNFILFDLYHRIMGQERLRVIRRLDHQIRNVVRLTIGHKSNETYTQRLNTFWNQTLYPTLAWLIQKIKDLWTQNAAFIRENIIFILTFIKSLKIHRLGKFQGSLFNASLFNITINYHTSPSFPHSSSYTNEFRHNLSHFSRTNEIIVNS
jgi:hypothetical protein